MKKLSLVSLAIALALAVSPAVSTAQSEDFTISIDNNGIDFYGSGTFSTAQTYSATVGGGSPSSEGYLITSFSGNLSVTPPSSAPYNGAVTLVLSTNPGGNFVVSDIQADNLLFLGNNVAGLNTGYLDNSGMIVAGGGFYVNIMTGQSINQGGAGLPYWVFYSPNGQYQFSTASSSPAILTVPEFGSISMLILCALSLACAFFFKGRQSGLFLNA